ncbi:MAG: methylmalonyl Co-A mutase-associated GTPase MeaB [Bacteroidota bacterium]
MEFPSSELLFKGIREGNKATLARGITLVESTQPAHFEIAERLVANCLSHPNASIRIGITGVPGVGKSTFIETFGMHLVNQGKKVAVLAVDPSSSLTKGSILGDKTRMETLARHTNAFIRPSPANDALGGVARKTRETMILCEAAGFDVLLVETVGVGQSEIAVHSMVDFFLLLKLAGAGDELQGIKRGIMEMADAVVINKADGTNMDRVKLAMSEFQQALHLYPKKESGWTPKVARCSALENRGIEEIWEMIRAFIKTTAASGYFEKNRIRQNKNWFYQTVAALLKQEFYKNEVVQKAAKALLRQIENKEISPYAAAQQLIRTKNS